MPAKPKEKDNGPEKKKDESLEREIGESFLKARKIFLWSAIDDEAAEKVVKLLLFLDQKEEADITILINSPGGVITSGFAIYDCMQSIRSQVSTVICGQAASMGAVLAAGGAKGKRYAWPSARIMIHQPLISGFVQGPASDIKIQAEEMLRIRKVINEILSKHTGKAEDLIETDTDRDNFMTAQEALAYGLIDKIEHRS